MSSPRWQVEIVHPVDGKPKLWDHYSTHERAQEIATMLRRHGIWSQVRRVDGEVEEPEHRNDRRAFLIFACMLGAVPPERVVERIVAELEHEARATS